MTTIRGSAAGHTSSRSTRSAPREVWSQRRVVRRPRGSSCRHVPERRVENSCYSPHLSESAIAANGREDDAAPSPCTHGLARGIARGADRACSVTLLPPFAIPFCPWNSVPHKDSYRAGRGAAERQVALQPGVASAGISRAGWAVGFDGSTSSDSNASRPRRSRRCTTRTPASHSDGSAPRRATIARLQDLLGRVGCPRRSRGVPVPRPRSCTSNDSTRRR